MDPIQPIRISPIYIRQLDIPNLYISDVFGYAPTATPPVVPVVVNIGKPIVNIPGCVEVHPENKYPNGTKNKQLAEDDDTVTYCDAHTPSFTPMNYEPEQLTIIQDIPAPEVEPPPEPEVNTPETPSIPSTSKEEVECPSPGQPRIGDLSQNGDEKVVGHELNEDKTICIVLYEPTTAVEKFLPQANVVTTTAVIATVATASALFAKPLADLILRALKPAIKQATQKVQKLLGQKQTSPDRNLVIANQYRLKKGLPPLPKKKPKKLKKTKKGLLKFLPWG
tara:strand:- start:2202 stop:3041 length:840 start_codon:yes stop_codon:yes gene_type:complete